MGSDYFVKFGIFLDPELVKFGIILDPELVKFGIILDPELINFWIQNSKFFVFFWIQNSKENFGGFDPQKKIIAHPITLLYISIVSTTIFKFFESDLVGKAGAPSVGSIPTKKKCYFFFRSRSFI